MSKESINAYLCSKDDDVLDGVVVLTSGDFDWDCACTAQQGNSMEDCIDCLGNCISDPGYRIVNMALINNIKVISIPGATSLIAALSISGLPSDKFFFEGFLPKKKGLNKRMKILSKLDATIIIFESPKRVVKTLNKILDFMGDRVVSLCKEITKIHETTYFGRISEVLVKISQNTIKGEFVVMVAKEGYEI